MSSLPAGWNTTLVIDISPVYQTCKLFNIMSSGRQPNSAAWYKEWNYWSFAEGATYIRLGGHHVGHLPTF